MSPKNPSRNLLPTADLAFAFGVKENEVRTCVVDELENNGINKRLPDHKRGQELKYNEPNINELTLQKMNCF
jgi:hypothetical protein